MAEHVAHSHFKAGLIVHVLAVVVPERLLIEVAKQMERFDAHISTVDAALQQRPEVFKAVGVDAPVDVLDSVIDDRMGILASQSLIGEKGIGVESSTSLNMLLYFRLESGLLAVCNDNCLDLAATLQDTHDGSFILCACSGDAASLDAQVHIAGLAADESFVSFHFAGQLIAGVVLQSEADAVEHEPCTLLSDSESAGHLAGTNAVLAVAENPISAHPLVESERAVLEDRSNLEAELLLATSAEPNPAGLDEGVLLRPATRAANNTIREPQIERVLKGAERIAEVDDCVLQCVRGFHSSNLRSNSLCVKYVIGLKRAPPLCLNR
jgi:hypothetical protein